MTRPNTLARRTGIAAGLLALPLLGGVPFFVQTGFAQSTTNDLIRELCPPGVTCRGVRIGSDPADAPTGPAGPSTTGPAANSPDTGYPPPGGQVSGGPPGGQLPGGQVPGRQPPGSPPNTGYAGAAPPANTFGGYGTRYGTPSGPPTREPSGPVIASPVSPPGSYGQPPYQGRTTTAPPGTAAVSLIVNFPTGSAQLSANAAKTLIPLGRALTSPDLARYRFRIEGHTDTVGPPDANQWLSERRAAAVRDFLVQGFRIDPGRLEIVGFGASQPLVPTPDQMPEPRNRRVQVINLGS